MTITSTAGVECDVTMEGSFHYRTIVKSDSLIGFITKAVTNQASCRNGNFFALNGREVLAGAIAPQTLPWHVRYESFTGTLPNITTVQIKIIDLSYLITTFGGFACLYKSTAAAPAVGHFTVVLGTIVGFQWRNERAIPLFNGPVCPAVATLANQGEVTLLGTTTRIRLTLI